jgi:hypothetical protein
MVSLLFEAAIEGSTSVVLIERTSEEAAAPPPPRKANPCLVKPRPLVSEGVASECRYETPVEPERNDGKTSEEGEALTLEERCVVLENADEDWEEKASKAAAKGGRNKLRLRRLVVALLFLSDFTMVLNEIMEYNKILTSSNHLTKPEVRTDEKVQTENPRENPLLEKPCPLTLQSVMCYPDIYNQAHVTHSWGDTN